MPSLATKEKCTGCGACANICMHGAIQMQEDTEGFLMPSFTSSRCIDCKLCETICPAISSVAMGTKCPPAYAMWSNKDRIKSSSGGAFSAFARMILEKGGIVYGAVYDDTMHLHHIGTDTVEGLDAMRGSKYMQSYSGDSFKKIKEHLSDGRWILFTGTPCQVAGLRSFLKKDYDTLLTLDLVCHGVPSAKIFLNYLKKLECRIDLAGKGLHVENYEFRRKDGWGISPSISTANNCRNLYGVDALYMEAFNACAIFRESCYHCDYAQIPRVGDCTIADFWGIGRYGTPFRHNTHKGVSLVLVNTEKGQRAWSDLSDVFMEKRELEEALIENHNLHAASDRHIHRDDIINAFLDQNMTLKEINSRYHLVDYSLKGIAKIWAAKTGLLNIAKIGFDYYKALNGST